MRSVVVTGVSTGIGRAVATDLVGRGYRVFGSVRRQADAESLRTALGKGFTPLVFDVTDVDAVRAAAAQVSEDLGEGAVLSGLVNNAGAAAGAGPLMHADLEEIRHQLEINVLGVVSVTQAFLPLLGARKPKVEHPGRIVNISSVGGKLAAPFIGAYAASKHAVEGLSDSWRRELLIYGIDVIIVGPGAVKTAIWDKASELDVSRFNGTDYESIVGGFLEEFVARGRKGLDPSVVAGVVRTALEHRKPKARYAPVPQSLINWTLPRLMPKRLLDRVIGAAVGLKR